MAQMLFEAAAGEIQQLRCRFEVDLSAEQVLVTKVCRQPWQLRVYVDTFDRPSREPMYGEGMPQLVWARPDPPARRLEPQFTQQAAQRSRCGVHCQR